jgi:hypothetical protein
VTDADNDRPELSEVLGALRATYARLWYVTMGDRDEATMEVLWQSRAVLTAHGIDVADPERD